jgi:hypothetical protein
MYFFGIYIYLEHHSVCPLVQIGDPRTKEGIHSPAGEGGGDPNSDDKRKSLALCILRVVSIEMVENKLKSFKIMYL